MNTHSIITIFGIVFVIGSLLISRHFDNEYKWQMKNREEFARLEIIKLQDQILVYQNELNKSEVIKRNGKYYKLIEIKQ